MTITGTHIAYLHLCHRKLWLMANGIRMENATGNTFVEEGQLLNDSSYDRRPQKWKELDLGHLKIDHFDPKTNTVREVKKSPKLEHSHIAQVKYYLLSLERRGVAGPRGLIEYPKQRRSTEVPPLSDDDRRAIEGWEGEVVRITALSDCPPLVKKGICGNCAFFDFCFV